MVAGTPVEGAVDHTSLPTLTLDTKQLGDLELILSGAFAPLSGFMTHADVTAVAERGVLADGTPWPIPVTLDVRADAIRGLADQVLLADPEGTPLAVLEITERAVVGDWVRLAGPVTGHRTPEHG